MSRRVDGVGEVYLTRGGRRLESVEAGARRRRGPVEPGAAGAKAVPIPWAAAIHMIVWVWGSGVNPASLVQGQFERALQTQCSACMPDE